MGSELLIARFLKKTERVLACFVRLSKSRLAIPSTPPKKRLIYGENFLSSRKEYRQTGILQKQDTRVNSFRGKN